MLPRSPIYGWTIQEERISSVELKNWRNGVCIFEGSTVPYIPSRASLLYNDVRDISELLSVNFRINQTALFQYQPFNVPKLEGRSVTSSPNNIDFADVISPPPQFEGNYSQHNNTTYW